MALTEEFYPIMLYSPEKVAQYCLHLHTSFLIGLLFGPEDGSDMFLLNRSTSIGSHDVVLQNAGLLQ
jgi:hypothetical protein